MTNERERLYPTTVDWPGISRPRSAMALRRTIPNAFSTVTCQRAQPGFDLRMVDVDHAIDDVNTVI
jgi:hypothetical protein|nr:hypothetical protein [uncultured Sphingomonas sp.]